MIVKDDYLWIKAIQEELKDTPKIPLSECSSLLQEFVLVVYRVRVGCISLKWTIFMSELKVKS